MTNSHHSITFVDREKIHIEDLFKPLINLRDEKRTLQKNKSLLIRNDDKEEEINRPLSIKKNTLGSIDQKQEIDKLNTVIESLSRRF